jgi:hypothetical protein
MSLNSISCIPNRTFEIKILKHDLFLSSSESIPGEVKIFAFSIVIMRGRYSKICARKLHLAAMSWGEE